MDREKYRALLADALPMVIETEDEHRRVLELIVSLAHAQTAEEIALLKLLAMLAERYAPKPATALRELMQARDLRPEDLGDLFDVDAAGLLSGRTRIDSDLAARLGDYFQVPPERFL